MKASRALLGAALLLDLASRGAAFTPGLLVPPRPQSTRQPRAYTATAWLRPPRRLARQWQTADDDKDDDKDDEEDSAAKKENPYADPNYPQLEFIDYTDPNYQVNQGATDEFFPATNAEEEPSTEEQVEAMREERRRKNDEFQFQTYYTTVLQEGAEFMGEWTIYKADTFLPELAAQRDGALPRLLQAGRTLKVVSSSHKEIVPATMEDQAPVDMERIFHAQRLADSKEDPIKAWKDDVDPDSGFGRQNKTVPNVPPPPEALEMEAEIMRNTYWPAALRAVDFRGPHGIMVVGKSYTIATGVDLGGNPVVEDTKGPFSEYRVEVGISAKDMRFRIKLDYALLEEGKAAANPPPLHLKSLTVCREGREFWPRREGKCRSVAERGAVEALFGPPGAEGGLYDPPPVGGEAQAAQYMLLNLEGRATALFPFLIDQSLGQGNQGWVTSLDWSPGAMRYQVDRKVHAGDEILGLRTLELSEVQSADADIYRPRDGGMNMRQ
jgi:hypothetical protein